MRKMFFPQLFFLSCIYAVYGGVVSDQNNPFLSDDFIEKTNLLANGKWTAERTFHPKTSEQYIKSLMGLRTKDKFERPDLLQKSQFGKEEDYTNLPRSFDSRRQWPECPSIQEIKDQSGCGSCWAVAATSSMSDRLCIHSPNHSIKTEVSTEDLLSCCDSCGNGCNGGDPEYAWKYWHENGLVSGGDYGSHNTCRPYVFKPCEHHVNGTRQPCKSFNYTPSCKKSCEKGYQKSYNEDKTYGKAPRHLEYKPNGLPLMKEIMTNGPIECGFEVYKDFVNYRKGVYEFLGWGKYIGGHAVRIIGWGEEHGTPYWLVANSWNTDWGDHGLFKIIRGRNEVKIEEGCFAGLPDFTERKHNEEEEEKSRSWGDLFQDMADRIGSDFTRFGNWVSSIFS